jgi:hypothetical protein
MEKKKLMMEGPVSLGAFTLLPVSETICIGEQIGGIVLFRFSKTPIAVVVISPTERRAFRMTGEEISLEALTAEIPEFSMAISGNMGYTYS